MTDTAVLEKILHDVLRETGVELAETGFPLIVRKGKNDLGKTVRFYLNYSAEEQSSRYSFSDGVELLTGKKIRKQDTVYVQPWGVKIIAEK